MLNRLAARLSFPAWSLAFLGLSLSFPGSGVVAARQEAPIDEAAVERMRADVTFLADDEQEGRAPGTAGIERSAEWIAKAFAEAGLKPAAGADGFFQPFTIIGSPRLGDGQQLEVTSGEGRTIKAELRKHFMPLSVGTAGRFENLPIVFAGYGITAKDESTGIDYDDYAGIDAKGKLVLIFRRVPSGAVEGSPFGAVNGRDSQYATFQHKLSNAFAHGAAGVLIVNDLAGLSGQEDELLLFTSAGLERLTQVPVVMLKRTFADELLAAAGVPVLEELEKRISADPKQPKPSGVELAGLKATGTIDIVQDRVTARNVIGVLEGSGPKADETIVVGGHYDHLGRGGRGSLAPFSKDIHNGADDNASGTALVMELARRLAKRDQPLPRRVVFMAFSGEERGLLGSRHYVANPLYPISDTVAMFNFDMVGRLGEKGQLTAFGVDSTPGLRDQVIQAAPKYGLEIRPNSDIAGNSDHASFNEKGIPVLFLFTGTHRDYHRPSDDTPLINFEGMSRIANLAEEMLLSFAERPDRPEFVAAPPSPPRPVSGMKVAMGVIPDYDESIKGLRINGARPGSAADKAGMKEGDIIVSIGDRPIGTIYDYMEALGRFNPGDEVSVTVIREGKELNLPVKLDAPAQTNHTPPAGK